MKTILYQPLFINPQAYFVFPQLYHIEKGDSYIEPANITGQLIINNLSEGLTLTPTVNVIQDSNQIDFSLFIGTIRKNDLRSFIGCHGDIFLFNRTLTEYEISWVKNNMMCSKPQELDKDDILKSLVVHYNIGKQGSNSIKSTNTLTDYSGNNRHATCKNFNWSNTEFVDDGKAMRLNGNGIGI